MLHVRLLVVEYLNLSNHDLGDDDEPEWMLDFAKRESSRVMTEKRKEFEERLEKTKKEEERQRIAIENIAGPRKKQVRGLTTLSLSRVLLKKITCAEAQYTIDWSPRAKRRPFCARGI